MVWLLNMRRGIYEGVVLEAVKQDVFNMSDELKMTGRFKGSEQMVRPIRRMN